MRIIAGKYGGRVFQAPKGLETRPTASRAREALFSILGDLEGKVVVDCYAGSGALGLEALSRGAKLVVFIEHSPPALKAIAANLTTLGANDATRLLGCSVLQAGSTLKTLAPLDWVLADPPWAIAQRALHEVAEVTRDLLAPGAGLVVGHRAKHPIELEPGSPLRLLQRRRWGDSGLSFFEPT
jgi:16S rRNA (guanine(966)-N(2))-methyltransferase RsmD